MSEHHYYAATGLQWACASTEEGALRKVVSDLGSDYFKRMKAKHGGMRVLVVRVDLPITAHYKISQYLPVDVPMGPVKSGKITTLRGKFEPDPAE